MVLVRLASRAVIATVDRAVDVSTIVGDLAKSGVRAVDVSFISKAETIEATAAATRSRGTLGALGKGSNWLIDPLQFEKAGLGLLIGAGPVASVLAQSPSSSLGGALVMQGIPPGDAVTFEGLLKNGKILVLCGVADRTMGERVRSVFDRNGASSIAYYSGRPYGTAFHGTGPGLR